jgi:hypothetical protein
MDFLFELPQTHGTVLPVSTTHETQNTVLPVTQLRTTIISYATDNYPNPPPKHQQVAQTTYITGNNFPDPPL